MYISRPSRARPTILGQRARPVGATGAPGVCTKTRRREYPLSAVNTPLTTSTIDRRATPFSILAPLSCAVCGDKEYDALSDDILSDKRHCV